MHGKLLLQVLHHSFGSASSHNINEGCFSTWAKVWPRSVSHKGLAHFPPPLSLLYCAPLLIVREEKILCMLSINNKVSIRLFFKNSELCFCDLLSSLEHSHFYTDSLNRNVRSMENQGRKRWEGKTWPDIREAVLTFFGIYCSVLQGFLQLFLSLVVKWEYVSLGETESPSKEAFCLGQGRRISGGVHTDEVLKAEIKTCLSYCVSHS